MNRHTSTCCKKLIHKFYTAVRFNFTKGAGILVGGKFYLEGLSWSNMENNYLQGNQGGSEYIETTIYSPSGMTYTTHQFIYH